jgi:peptidoglycan hydrolase CwlO-like protein
MSHRVRTPLIALAALLLPLAASAQQQPPAEVQEWIEELQQIQARLQPLQEQALQDSALQEERDEVTSALRSAMIEADPDVAEKLERMDELLERARTAQEAGDAQAMIAINEEAQGIQPHIAQAQAQALARPDIQDRIDAFQQNLRQRMTEIDPEAPRLMERAEQLEARIVGAR